MSVDQLASYARQSNRNAPGGSRLPDWVYEQKFNYPLHPKHQELTGEYEKAYLTHLEWCEIVRSAVVSKMSDPSNEQKLAELDRCREREAQARGVLKQAEQALREFISHSPEERIKLIEAEIAQLEISLLEAHAAEREYTEAMLNDPDAARKRLDRQINGYSGAEAEYLPEQLAGLRSLRNAVEEIEGRILNARLDIQQIEKLVAEMERKRQAQEVTEPATLEFNQACDALDRAMKKLEAIALKHEIRVIKGDLRAPTSATFNQGGDVVHIKLKN